MWHYQIIPKRARQGGRQSCSPSTHSHAAPMLGTSRLSAWLCGLPQNCLVRLYTRGTVEWFVPARLVLGALGSSLGGHVPPGQNPRPLYILNFHVVLLRCHPLLLQLPGPRPSKSQDARPEIRFCCSLLYPCLP